MACETCRLPFDNDDDALSCNGICERKFHPVLKCSGLKNDVVKIMRRKPCIHFVCQSCSKIKMCDVMQAVKLCNDEFLLKQGQMQSKIDDLAAMSSSFLKRTSLLENSVNEVFDVGDPKFDDDALSRIELSITKLLESFMTRMDLKLHGIVSAVQDSLNPCFQLDECVRSINSITRKLDSSIDARDLKLESISENMFDLRQQCESMILLQSRGSTESRSLNMDDMLSAVNAANHVLRLDMESMRSQIDSLSNDLCNDPSFKDELLSSVNSANDLLRVDIDSMKAQLDNLLHELCNYAFPHASVIDDGSPDAIFDDSSSSFVTVDNIAFDDVSVNEQPIHVDSDQNAPMTNDNNHQWIYVASADYDFSLKRLKNLLLWNFGVDDVKIDLLSHGDDVTYKSFKFAIPMRLLSAILNLKNWPETYYVRKFDTEKKAVFRQGQDNPNHRKSNFVHNPLKLRI